MEIRNFISQYLKSRDMTMTDFTSLLGYKSKTSVVRIMKGDVSQRTLGSFFEKIQKSGNLTGAEAKALNLAMEKRQWQEDYYPSREMQALLEGANTSDAKITLHCVNGARGECTFEKRYTDATSINILLINCQSVPLFTKLRRLIREKDAHIRHFLLVGEDTSRTIRAVNTILPIMHEPNYTGYINAPCEDENLFEFSRAHLLIMNYTDGQGVPREDAIMFDAPDHGRLFEVQEPGTFEAFVRIPTSRFVPLKHTYPEESDSLSFVDFCAKCAHLERKRALFSIRSDVPFSCIPTPILYAAAVEGPFSQNKSFYDMLGTLEEIFDRRHINILDKRKPSHFVMKRSALWRFARTGRLSDHFWGIRAFTPAERARIFRTILVQAQENPYFHIYFVKDDDKFLDHEMTCYEDEAMLIANSDTNYDLSEGYAEVLIRHPEFMRLFKDYFLKHLIREEVVSHSEAQEFMHTLIHYCENGEEA